MEPRWQPTTFPTRRHERVHGLLGRLISEGASHFFADACEIVQRRPPFRTTTHIVAHLIREVESATRQVLRTLPKAAAHIQANPNAKKKGETHLAEIDAVLQALGLNGNKLAEEWRSFVGEDGWHGNAHRDDLRSPRTLDASFESRLATFVEVLLVVLDAAEGRYADLITALDAVAGKATPSSDDLKYVAVHLAPGVTALSHVFEKLSPSWLIPLRERNVFSEPPETRHHDGGAISFPSWPQAHYLYRIAADLPEEVATTIESIPTVDNESVHLRLLEAAARMPPAVAARVAKHEMPWLEQRKRWVNGLLPEAVTKLAVGLIDGGELDAGVALARVALALVPDDDPNGWRRPTARFESWSYGKTADRIVAALTAHAPNGAIDLLTDLIANAGPKGPWSWGRRIDRDPQAGIDEPVDILFAHLRDIYLSRAARGAAELREVVQTLEATGVPIYKQLALHALRLHGRVALDLVVERATDPARLGAGDEDDEITMLIRDRFADLVADDQARVIAALRLNASEDALRREFKDTLSGERLSFRSRHRLLKWLHALGDARPANLAVEYEGLVAELGVPEPFDSGPLFGPVPPRRASDMLALTDAELLAYLRDWIPSTNDPFEPSRAGLARELQLCVAQQPERFARLAREFRNLAPVYIGHLFWGIHEITKQRTTDPAKPVVLPPIDWASVLDLLEWTAKQTTTSEDEEAPGNWTWPRRMGVDLAEDAVAATVRADHTLATRGWEIVRALMSDADPTPARDAEKWNDVDTFAINTVRGQAIHAAIRVAQTAKTAGAAAPPAMLPDALAAIEARSISDREPSDALRCILAMRFNALFNLDAALARRIAGGLFPSSPEQWDARRAAWRSFLLWNSPAKVILDVLREPYTIAVQHIAEAEEKMAGELGEHLAWLVLWRAIDIESDENLARSFVEHAGVVPRRHALSELGRALHRTEETINGDLLDRTRRLWEWWLGLSAKRGDAIDLVAFGWWFASKHLDPSWSLPMLERVLSETGGRIEWDHEVLEKLATLAPAHADAVAGCLRRIIDSPDDWLVIRNGKEIRAALTALASTPASSRAKDIASRLVARGFAEFQALA